MRLVPLLVVLLATAAPAQTGEALAADHPHLEALVVLDNEALAAFVVLRDAEEMTPPELGYGDRIVGYAAALRVLVADEHAQIAIDALWRSENPMARLYALAGFWYLRPGEYREALESLRGDESPIETRTGCITFRTTVDEFLGDAGEVSIVPGASLREGFCNTEGRSIKDLQRASMASGFLPMLLLEGPQFGCRRSPNEEWPRLSAPAAWPNPDSERLRRLQRENASRGLRVLSQAESDAMAAVLAR